MNTGSAERKLLGSFSIPGMKLVSEANAHEHWRVRQKRAKVQRSTAEVFTRSAFDWDGRGLRVVIFRIATRELDSDNLVGSAKHVRDGIADGLRVNDRDKRIDWVVSKEKAKAGYGVRVEFWAGTAT